MTLNANDGEKDENNDGKNDENNVSGEDVSNVETQMDAIKKCCSSFVFVTGCMYTENDENFLLATFIHYLWIVQELWGPTGVPDNSCIGWSKS